MLTRCDRHAGVRRIEHDGGIVLTPDRDCDRGHRRAALAIRDLVGVAVGRRFARSEAIECPMRIVAVGAVRVHGEHGARRQRNRSRTRGVDGVAVDQRDRQRIGVEAAVVVLARRTGCNIACDGCAVFENCDGVVHCDRRRVGHGEVERRGDRVAGDPVGRRERDDIGAGMLRGVGRQRANDLAIDELEAGRQHVRRDRQRIGRVGVAEHVAHVDRDRAAVGRVLRRDRLVDDGRQVFVRHVDRQRRGGRPAVSVVDGVGDARVPDRTGGERIECVVGIERIRAVGLDREDAAGGTGDRRTRRNRSDSARRRVRRRDTGDSQRIVLGIGVVRQHAERRDHGERAIGGNRIDVDVGDRVVILPVDDDRHASRRKTALAIADLVDEAVGCRLAHLQVGEGAVGVIAVGAVGVHCQKGAGRQCNLVAYGSRAAVDLGDGQRVGVGTTVMVVAEDACGARRNDQRAVLGNGVGIGCRDWSRVADREVHRGRNRSAMAIARRDHNVVIAVMVGSALRRPGTKAGGCREGAGCGIEHNARRQLNSRDCLERQRVGAVWIGKERRDIERRDRRAVLAVLVGNDMVWIDRRAGMGRIDDDGRLILPRDGDRDGGSRNAALAVADLIAEMVGGVLPNREAVESAVGIVAVGAVGVHHQKRAGRQRDRTARRVGRAVDLADRQRVGIEPAIVIANARCVEIGDDVAARCCMLGNCIGIVDCNRRRVADVVDERRCDSAARRIPGGERHGVGLPLVLRGVSRQRALDRMGERIVAEAGRQARGGDGEYIAWVGIGENAGDGDRDVIAVHRVLRRDRLLHERRQVGERHRDRQRCRGRAAVPVADRIGNRR